MRAIRRIFIHCSASPWGDVAQINEWHLQRGWKGIGYHYVVTNLFPTWRHWKDVQPVRENDGKVWEGRSLDRVGAHVAGANADSIGVCLVGHEAFSASQVDAAVGLCVGLCRRFKLGAEDIWGHNEIWTRNGEAPKKECPNIPMEEFRKQVDAKLKMLRASCATGACEMTM